MWAWKLLCQRTVKSNVYADSFVRIMIFFPPLSAGERERGRCRGGEGEEGKAGLWTILIQIYTVNNCCASVLPSEMHEYCNFMSSGILKSCRRLSLCPVIFFFFFFCTLTQPTYMQAAATVQTEWGETVRILPDAFNQFSGAQLLSFIVQSGPVAVSYPTLEFRHDVMNLQCASGVSPHSGFSVSFQKRWKGTIDPDCTGQEARWFTI